jgi:hypothetical protein
MASRNSVYPLVRDVFGLALKRFQNGFAPSRYASARVGAGIPPRHFSAQPSPEADGDHVRSSFSILLTQFHFLCKQTKGICPVLLVSSPGHACSYHFGHATHAPDPLLLRLVSVRQVGVQRGLVSRRDPCERQPQVAQPLHKASCMMAVQRFVQPIDACKEFIFATVSMQHSEILLGMLCRNLVGKSSSAGAGRG